MVSREKPSPGRPRQRQRTREALLEAAGRLIDRGEAPRLASVATEAGVSRATAYRYFPSEQALLLEAPLARHFASAEEVLAGREGETVEERVLAVHRYLFGHAAAHEARFRLFLSAVHEEAARGDAPPGPLRAGRRREMFERALAPARARLGAAGARRLGDALAALTGIDGLVALRDVCGVPPARAGRTLAWAIATLVGAALAEAGGRRRPPRPRDEG